MAGRGNRLQMTPGSGFPLLILGRFPSPNSGSNRMFHVKLVDFQNAHVPHTPPSKFPVYRVPAIPGIGSQMLAALGRVGSRLIHARRPPATGIALGQENARLGLEGCLHSPNTPLYVIPIGLILGEKRFGIFGASIYFIWAKKVIILCCHLNLQKGQGERYNFSWAGGGRRRTRSEEHTS